MAKKQMKPEMKVATSGLTKILERDENGKPILNLTPLNYTVVNT